MSPKYYQAGPALLLIGKLRRKSAILAVLEISQRRNIYWDIVFTITRLYFNQNFNVNP